MEALRLSEPDVIPTGSIKSKMKYADVVDPLLDRHSAPVTIALHTPQLVFQGYQRVYFASNANLNSFVENPKRFFNLPLNPEITARPDMMGLAVRCPVMGNESRPFIINNMTPRLQVTNGQYLYFASQHCISTFLRNGPETYIQLDTSKTPFTSNCVLSGKMIELGATTTARSELKGGQHVYFCCNDCLLRFNSEPRNFYIGSLDNIPAETYNPTGFLIHDPVSNNTTVVSHTTPRILLKHGQSLFFETYDTLTDFVQKPVKYLLTETKHKP